MTTAADDRADERAFEACLAGRPVPGEAASLAAFTEAVRATATRPGRPDAALAELLTTGLITDLSSPSARTARETGSPPPRGAAGLRNRRRLTMILPVLIAKFLSAGAVAQAATGAGVAVVLVTGAGSVGVLPGPVQETFSTVTGVGTEEVEPTDEVPAEPLVEEPAVLDPEEPADGVPSEGTTDPADPTGESEDVAEETPEPVEVEAEDEGDDDSFGREVSEDARDGGVDGQEVSEKAKERNEKKREQKAAEREAKKDRKDKNKDKNKNKSQDGDRDDEDDEDDDEGDDD